MLTCPRPTHDRFAYQAHALVYDIIACLSEGGGGGLGVAFSKQEWDWPLGPVCGRACGRAGVRAGGRVSGIEPHAHGDMWKVAQHGGFASWSRHMVAVRRWHIPSTVARVGCFRVECGTHCWDLTTHY